MNEFKKYIKETYGDYSIASKKLGIKYQTLVKNINHPTNGWKVLVQIVIPLQRENEILREKLNGMDNLYNNLLSKYNDVINKDNEEEEKTNFDGESIIF